MDPGTTILRVKRKRCTDPADALLLACKRVRAESSPVQSEPEPEPERIENSVFKLVATVSSQDTPVQTHVREALSRPRLAHALRPSHGSSTRVISDLRNTKWTTRREERYRILSSHRAGLPTEPRIEHEPEEKVQTDTGSRLGDVQVFDIVQEDGEEHEKDPEKNMESDTETILCNSVKMMREKLSMSTHGTEHREKEDDYVYDLYYQEKATPGWIQDILSVRPYTEEGQLVPDEVALEEEVYEDEDDENAESNWRNDYPDEDSDDENNEERYGGCWSEEHSYSRRSWERYQREVMKDLEEDEDGEEFDSD